MFAEQLLQVFRAAGFDVKDGGGHFGGKPERGLSLRVCIPDTFLPTAKAIQEALGSVDLPTRITVDEINRPHDYPCISLQVRPKPHRLHAKASRPLGSGTDQASRRAVSK